MVPIGKKPVTRFNKYKNHIYCIMLKGYLYVGLGPNFE